MDKITYFGKPGLMVPKINKPNIEKLSEDLLNSLLEATKEYCSDKYTINDVKARNRDRSLVMVRQAFCYIMIRTYPNIRLKYIAKLLNYNDHTTVIHGIKTFKNLLDTDYEQAVYIYNRVKTKYYLQ